MAPDDPKWGWFTEDQLVVRHPDGWMVDVGWYPDNDPTGRFRLVVLAGDSAQHWRQEPVYQEELASPRAVEEAVLRICGGETASPARPAPEEVGYAAGSEYDPGDPFGLCTLTVAAAGAVRLVNRQRGRERVFHEDGRGLGVHDPAKTARRRGVPDHAEASDPGGTDPDAVDDDRG